MPWRQLRSGWLALTGAAGVVLAHFVGYTVAYPHGHERAVYLYAAGHGYWPFAVAGAVAATSAALAAAVGHGWTQARRPHRMPPPRRFWPRLVGLTTWQMLLFGTMETVERAHTGASPAVLWSSPEFAIGLAAQVVVALVALLLLHSFERLGSLAATALGRRRRRVPHVVRRPYGRLSSPGPLGWSSTRSRAPPGAVALQL